MKTTSYLAAALLATVLACGSNPGQTDTNEPQDVTNSDSLADSTADAVDGIDPDEGRDLAVDQESETVEDTGGELTVPDTVDEDGHDTNDIVEIIEPVPVPPHALCDMPAYELLPPGSLGDLVEFEPIPLLTLDADTINGLLDGFGFDAMSPVPYGAITYRYRYTTQDRGQQVEATGLMAFPANKDPFTDPLPILLYQHGTSGFSDPCAPSADENHFEMGALGPAFSSLGFVVIAPDYIGLNGFGDPATVRHGYLVGEQTAIGAWDAVRGGLKLLESIEGHPPVSNKVIIWGQSQGGHASLFTELWGPWYAPEFKVPGVVAQIPPTDLLPMMQNAMQEIDDPTGLLAVSVVTMQLWYGETADLETVFTNEDPYFVADVAPTLLFPEDKCGISIGVDIDDVTLETVFQPGFLQAAQTGDWDAIGPWKCYYLENSLAFTSVPVSRHTPTMMIYGENDTLLITDTQKDDFDRLCQAGYRLHHIECAGAGHTQAALWSLPEQFDWIRDRLDGKPTDAADECVYHDPVRCSATPEE